MLLWRNERRRGHGSLSTQHSTKHGLPAESGRCYNFLTEVLTCDIDLESPILPFGSVTTLKRQLKEVRWMPSAEFLKTVATLFGTEDLSLVLGNIVVDCVEYIPTEMSKLFFLPL